MAATRKLQKVLVTGATGSLGARIVAALCDGGWSVSTYSLDDAPEGTFPDGVAAIRGDIVDVQAVEDAVRGNDYVIHLAALLHIVDPPPGLRDKYERVNVGGTEAVMRAALKMGVRRVVFFSTIAVYASGNVGSAVFDENSPPRPETFYSETKLAAERVVLNARCPDGQPLGVVLRLGAVYGSRIKGNYQRLVHALARGWFIAVGNGANRRTMVYEKDVAGAAVLAMQHPAAAGKIYNVTDGRFHTVSEITAAVCMALGRKTPSFSVPLGPARVVAGILEDVARLARCRSPVNRATILKYVEDVAVSGERIREELGFHAEYDLETGWRETIREMRANGEL